MLQDLFHSTVSALCYEIAADQCASHTAPADRDGDLLAPPYNDVTRFVILQHRGMPQFLGAGVQLATLLFALAALPRGGLFHRLPPPRRGPQVAAWTVSPLGPCRDLMRLYTSLVILALYSRPCLELAIDPVPHQAMGRYS